MVRYRTFQLRRARAVADEVSVVPAGGDGLAAREVETADEPGLFTWRIYDSSGEAR